jgi:hypothetical protein
MIDSTAVARIVVISVGVIAAALLRVSPAGGAPRPPSPAALAATPTRIHLQLKRLRETATLSFGLPLPGGRVKGPEDVHVTSAGRPLEADVQEILAEHDKQGRRVGTRAVLIRFAAPPELGEVDVELGGAAQPKNARAVTPRPYDDPSRSFASPELVETRTRSLSPRPGGGAVLVEGPLKQKTLWVGREPNVLVTYPEGYLAHSGLLGAQVTAKEAQRGPQTALRFLSDAAASFAGSAIYDLPYAPSPDPASVPDPKSNYEMWLYDRCATFLLVAAHTEAERFARHALRTCAYYARQIRTDGANRGTFTGKPEVDPKYSHARGLYAYYALTGDDAARAALTAIADYWLSDEIIVADYAAGKLRGVEQLWTERLLGTALEGLYYGHRLTGDAKYLAMFRRMLDTAYRHVTGDAAELAKINPGVNFPPQNCFVHNAAQHAEAGPEVPWCSGWMVELLLDPLLRYQEQTQDPRVDEILIRLTRFLRDVGSAYFHGSIGDDTFLAPNVCDTAADESDRRMLTPLYGAGIDAHGKRVSSGDDDDIQHCVDASSLVAAGLRALRRQGTFDSHPVGPFKSEGESFVQLHQELAACAVRVFADSYRPKRAPSAWGPDELAEGLRDPKHFLLEKRIGFPLYVNNPGRRLSWWFNSSLESWGLLEDARVVEERLAPGRIKGKGCP